MKLICAYAINVGFPSVWDGNGSLYPKKYYDSMMAQCRNNDTKFIYMEGALKKKVVMDKLVVDFKLLTRADIYRRV